MRRVWQPLYSEVPDQYAVGSFFVPADQKLRSTVQAAIERCLAEQGLRAVAWRDVPMRQELAEQYSRAAIPCVRQALVLPCAPEGSLLPHDFERTLYIARRHMENSIRPELCGPDDFSVSSLSSQGIIYKGMVPGGLLAALYPDLASSDFESYYAIFHERYSTNTQPAWRLAQPFPCLAHNGEINTLAANQTAMRIREPLLSSPLFGNGIRHLVPVLDPYGSDSAMLGNALEFLLHGGRSLAHAAMMLVPEPFGASLVMGQDKRAFYEYHAALMEPWDGPAALVFTDNQNQIGAMLDRNALRPCRYVQTTDGFFVLASEAGVLDIAPERIATRGRLQSRRILLVDFAKRRVISDAECKGQVILRKPYRHWVREQGIRLNDLPLPPGTSADAGVAMKHEELERQNRLYGFSDKEIQDVLSPMGKNAQEPVVSMGIDTPLAALSRKPELLFSYLKQRFAQVTNPPIDPLREELVMTLTGFVGKIGNALEERPEHYRRLRLPNPVLFPEDLARLEASEHDDLRMLRVPMLFPAFADRMEKEQRDAERLEKALAAMCAQAEHAVVRDEKPVSLILLSDADADAAQAPIPSLLAVSALHQHLLRKKLRHACSIMVDTGEAREPMHLTQLLAFGASAIHPRQAFALLASLAKAGRLGANNTAQKAWEAYSTALNKGLLKNFSRMGVSTLRSFIGGQYFEALGLGNALISHYFTGLPSRIGGIGLKEIAQEALTRHQAAWSQESAHSTGRKQKEHDAHLWSPAAVRALHKAVRDKDADQYQRYAKSSDMRNEQPVTLRNMLDFAQASPVPLAEVEPEEHIIRRFVGAAMSLGSISPEAHTAIAIALNRVGGRSNCGEGGEDPERLKPLADGGSSRSRIRQIASGRFGVTASYLVNAEEIQIKIAQGAKPGEGGQLPAHKVLPEIARLRHTVPGVTLISPPPHHDIYSIEDLAQLVHDVKRLNPLARISVKLVAGTNIGTVACGVVKAGADSILISGHDGGTGASPRTAIHHVGLPWELGLAEVHHALVRHGLRKQVHLQADGQLHTGRDIVVAALLGADEFGFGTSLLVSLGCCMLRICHLGTCPVGIATQSPELRARFQGSPEHIECFLRFLARDVRERMADLGMRSVDEMIGRADVLRPLPISFFAGENAPELQTWQDKLASLDLRSLCSLASPTEPDNPHCITKIAQILPDHKDTALDQAMLQAVMPGVRARRPAHFEHDVHNTDRSVCVRLSGEIARLYGEAGLASGMVDIRLKGTAGQSAGAFLAHGIKLSIEGEANDYVGKGLSGGVISVAPPRLPQLQESCMRYLHGEQTVIGNVALYGATSGELYAAGAAGERFAVRNSGAHAVVEGVGDHACEYMTGGVVVVLGATGYNFAAGMNGGLAFVLDGSERFQTRCNMDSVDIESVWEARDIILLRSLLDKHLRYTKSPFAASILKEWNAVLPLFLKVTPIEYKHVLHRIRLEENRGAEQIASTEEVYRL
ncbi:glutamate synthase large subunit [Desulfovibrionales bacterium]